MKNHFVNPCTRMLFFCNPDYASKYSGFSYDIGVKFWKKAAPVQPHGFIDSSETNALVKMQEQDGLMGFFCFCCFQGFCG